MRISAIAAAWKTNLSQRNEAVSITRPKPETLCKGGEGAIEGGFTIYFALKWACKYKSRFPLSSVFCSLNKSPIIMLAWSS